MMMSTSRRLRVCLRRPRRDLTRRHQPSRRLKLPLARVCFLKSSSIYRIHIAQGASTQSNKQAKKAKKNKNKNKG
jgi:hypothetical protein